MRKKNEIEKRIEELEAVAKIANKNLKNAIKEKDEKKERYWEMATVRILEQIYGMKFALGMVE